MGSLTGCYNLTSVPKNHDDVNFCWKWQEISIQVKERTFFKLSKRKSNRMQQLIGQGNEFSKFAPEFATGQWMSEYQDQVFQIYFSYEGWGEKIIFTTLNEIHFTYKIILLFSVENSWSYLSLRQNAVFIEWCIKIMYYKYSDFRIIIKNITELLYAL